ncbi:MAG: NHLP bacteriocin system secretion protein [Nodosilinea sp.]
MVTSPNQKLFRKEALERSASPEQLDQLIQVVSPKRWLSLAALGSLVTAGTAWSLFGQIPTTVTGQGLLIYPSDMVTVQSDSSGQIASIEVSESQIIKVGDVIATIDQSELKTQLELAQQQLTQLQQQDTVAQQQQQQRKALDVVAIAQQRRTLEQELRSLQTLTPVLRTRAVESLTSQRQALNQQIATQTAMLETYQQRWENWQSLEDKGAMSKEQVLEAQLTYQEAQTQLNQLQAELEALDVQDTEAQQSYLSNQTQISELQAQLQELQATAAAQGEQDMASGTVRQKEIQTTERTIAQLQQQLARDGKITSNYGGQVVEIMAQPGQRLDPGVGVSLVATHAEGEDQLTSVAFLPVSDGMKITEGMALQVTPTTVKREEYGGIVGTVERVSSFPVTQAGAARLVGNPDILPGIMGQGPHIAVFARLERDENSENDSGLRWSASPLGPKQVMSPGMTTTVRVTVETRRPISYVMPFLKELLGGGDGDSSTAEAEPS